MYSHTARLAEKRGVNRAMLSRILTTIVAGLIPSVSALTLTGKAFFAFGLIQHLLRTLVLWT